jgi:hypothetical protein
MRRMVVVIGLIGALSGPLLRQVEAASDWARVLDAVAQLGAEDVLATPDGGVGDDTGETTWTRGEDHSPASGLSPSGDGWATIYTGASPLLVLPPANSGASQRPLSQAPWLPSGASQRHAWLQLFLC